MGWAQGKRSGNGRRACANSGGDMPALQNGRAGCVALRRVMRPFEFPSTTLGVNAQGKHLRAQCEREGGVLSMVLLREATPLCDAVVPGEGNGGTLRRGSG